MEGHDPIPMFLLRLRFAFRFSFSTGIKRQERNSSLPKMSQKDAQVEKAKQLHDAIQKMTEEKIFERQLFGVGVVGL